MAVDVTIMLGGEHHSEWLSTYMFNKIFKGRDDIEGVTTTGDVIIGNDVWIGNGAKILSGVTIGNGCVIGANALVTKNMDAYTICGGVPAKMIRKRFGDETIEKLEKIKWWDWPEWNIYKARPLLQNNDIEKLIEYYESEIAKN
jgi:acetyltransferase-like isoleucine patch superfamily enzyme